MNSQEIMSSVHDKEGSEFSSKGVRSSLKDNNKRNHLPKMEKKLSVTKDITDDKLERLRRQSQGMQHGEATYKPHDDSCVLQNTDKELDEQFDKGLKPWNPPSEQHFEEQRG